MTVGELMETLKHYDENAQVFRLKVTNEKMMAGKLEPLEEVGKSYNMDTNMGSVFMVFSKEKLAVT